MTSVGRTIAIAVLAVATSACMIASSGPDENRPERFEFIPSPAGQQETVEAFRALIGPGEAGTGVLDETTVKPLGKITGSRGTIFFADFQMIDSVSGRSQCGGSAGPGGGGWGCGPIGAPAPPEDLPLDPVMLSSSGSSGTWSDVQLRASDDVAFLEAVAQDGTTYRMEPIAGFAWMEWKSERGELVITAFDRDGEAIGSVETDAT